MTVGQEARRRLVGGVALRTAAAAVGTVLLVLGVAGFVPGLTEDLDELGLAGPASGARLLGVFRISVLLNAAHLVAGAIGVLSAASPGSGRAFLVIGGVVGGVVQLYRLIVDGAVPNVVPLNAADDVLHLGLAVGMAALGVGLPALAHSVDARR